MTFAKFEQLVKEKHPNARLLSTESSQEIKSMLLLFLTANMEKFISIMAHIVKCLINLA